MAALGSTAEIASSVRLRKALQESRVVAVVRLGSIGDVLATVPFAWLLRDLAPGARIVWIAHPESTPLLRCVPAIDDVVQVRRGPVIRAMLGWRRVLRKAHIDLVVDLHGNLKSGVVDLLTGARFRLGFHRKDCREHWNPLATNLRFPRLSSRQKTLRALEAARCLGHPEPKARHGLVFPEAARARAESVLTDLHAGSPIAVLQLGRLEDVRSWPLPFYAEAVKQLEELGWQPVIVGGPAEVPAGEELSPLLEARGLRPRLEIGTLSLEELGALLQALAARPDARGVFVGPDSGAIHLAAACGLRTLGLFGPHHPARTGPIGPHAEAAFHPEAGPCVPCGRRECVHVVRQKCMLAISPAEVVGRLTGLSPVSRLEAPAAIALPPTPILGPWQLGLAAAAMLPGLFSSRGWPLQIVDAMGPALTVLITSAMAALLGGRAAASFSAVFLWSTAIFIIPGHESLGAWVMTAAAGLFALAYVASEKAQHRPAARCIAPMAISGWLCWRVAGPGGIGWMAVTLAVFHVGEKGMPRTAPKELLLGLLGACVLEMGSSLAFHAGGVAWSEELLESSPLLTGLLEALPGALVLPWALFAHLKTRRYREDLGFADRRWRLPKAAFVSALLFAIVLPLAFGVEFPLLAAYPFAAVLAGSWLAEALRCILRRPRQAMPSGAI